VKFEVEMEQSSMNNSEVHEDSGPQFHEHRERRDFLKTEHKQQLQTGGIFKKEPSEKNLINSMLELVLKSNMLMDLVKTGDSLKVLEMSINKQEIMLEKSKLMLLKLDNMYLVVPLTLNKIEVKTRNVLINSKPKLDGLSKFLRFYLDYSDLHQAGIPHEESEAIKVTK
jgi:hypothetical protein